MVGSSKGSSGQLTLQHMSSMDNYCHCRCYSNFPFFLVAEVCEVSFWVGMRITPVIKISFIGTKVSLGCFPPHYGYYKAFFKCQLENSTTLGSIQNDHLEIVTTSSMI